MYKVGEDNEFSFEVNSLLGTRDELLEGVEIELFSVLGNLELFELISLDDSEKFIRDWTMYW